MPKAPQGTTNVSMPDRVSHWLQIADRALGNPRYWPEGASFVKAELGLGLAFSRIALDSSNVDTITRNTANARLAYEGSLRFVRKVLLTPDDSIEIDNRFGQLKADLVRLGQRF